MRTEFAGLVPGGHHRLYDGARHQQREQQGAQGETQAMAATWDHGAQGIGRPSGYTIADALSASRPVAGT